MFYNTTNETGADLAESRRTAGCHTAAVLNFFMKRPTLEFSAFEVHEALGLSSTPITSTRRAMTVLTTEGHLVKTGTRKMGPYGKKGYCWRYR